jgi:endonuclease YncB( thermonuclease family)
MLQSLLLLPTMAATTATAVSCGTHCANAAATSATADVATASSVLDSLPSFSNPVVANPFVQLETVGMVPKAYFDQNVAIYAFVERILDGDTLRVRHVPGFSLTQQTPEPLPKRGIADDTLVIRLYGVDCPEIAKNKKQVSQPFGEEAKQFASDLVYRQMVKITFIRKDRYGRAIAMVETLPKGGFLLSGVLPGLGPKDLTIELARAGLAELYTGGGSEYYVRFCFWKAVPPSSLSRLSHSTPTVPTSSIIIEIRPKRVTF